MEFAESIYVSNGVSAMPRRARKASSKIEMARAGTNAKHEQSQAANRL